MRSLLVTALLVALPGIPRAEGAAPPAQAEKPAKAQKAGRAKAPADGKARPKAARGDQDANPDAKEKDGAKGAGAPAQKPCEPVKPCPID